MTVFKLYLSLGVNHILDLEAYDHILFIVSLTAIYLIKQWKQILILVTAFTLGHTTTLVLSTLNIININPQLVEFLIPITIIFTGFANIFVKDYQKINKKLYYIKYSTSVFFGLIHGLGFSSYLKSMLSSENNLVIPLLSFNLGIELGQFIIVIIIISLSYIIVNKLKFPQREWALLVSGAGIGVALILALQRIYW